MTLMPTPAKGVEAYKAASMFTGPNWCARCSSCGETLTKYCFDEEEALRQATESIDRGECRCAKRLQTDKPEDKEGDR